MSQKVLDRKGRFRNKIISFRVSPEESIMLERKVKLSGLTKQDYLINSILDKEIVVEPNPYGLVNYYPSLILLNKVNVHWVYVIMIALVDMIYGVIGAFLWRRGLKRYNGSGS